MSITSRMGLIKKQTKRQVEKLKELKILEIKSFLNIGVIIMSKNSTAIKKRMNESEEFEKAYVEEQRKLDLADLIFELRSQTGLNQTKFAEKVNKSRSTIARIENATMEPSLSTIEDIAEAVGKRVELKIIDL